MIAELIQKEQVPFLKFPKQDVLHKTKDQIDRFPKLQRAISLGNLEQRKVKIIFEDDQGVKKVETSSWGITDNEVILKQAVMIPLQSIVNSM